MNERWMNNNKWMNDKWTMINEQTINGRTIHEQTIHEQTMNEKWMKAKQTTMMAKANSTKIQKSFQHNVDCCVLIHRPPSMFVVLVVVLVVIHCRPRTTHACPGNRNAPLHQPRSPSICVCTIVHLQSWPQKLVPRVNVTHSSRVLGHTGWGGILMTIHSI